MRTCGRDRCAGVDRGSVGLRRWVGARGWPRPPLSFFVPALHPCSTRASQGLPKRTREGTVETVAGHHKWW